MKKDDARRQITSEFRAWCQREGMERPTGTDALNFFMYLERERPELLAFKASGDKWQSVHSFLLSAKLVND